MTLYFFFTHRHSPFLPVFQCFREGESLFVQNHRLVPGTSLRPRAGDGVGQILPTPAPIPIPAKAFDSNSDLDSDFAALVLPASHEMQWGHSI